VGNDVIVRASYLQSDKLGGEEKRGGGGGGGGDADMREMRAVIAESERRRV